MYAVKAIYDGVNFTIIYRSFSPLENLMFIKIRQLYI